MTRLLTPNAARAGLPASWPTPLHPAELNLIDVPTPFLACDLNAVRAKYRRLVDALPAASVHYAMKCNSTPELLRALAAAGSSFEVASIGELSALVELGIDPVDVLFSNPVKPPAAITQARAAGLWRFSFDSEGELYKIARQAPGSGVYVRLRVDDSSSVFPLSRKFGAELHQARALLLLARSLGLQPYGVTFHVGSQCTATSTWRQAVACAGRLMSDLLREGVMLQMLDIGGGIPAYYGASVPTVDQVGAVLRTAMAELLPYQPEVLAVEPGRYLVAESAVLAATVLGREVRAGEDWVYLDVGAYNGLMETQQTVNGWSFPLWTSRADHEAVTHSPFTVTGPSCDSSDTMFHGVLLPSTIDVGDRIYIGSAGAYTLAYASTFNGFPVPSPVFVGHGP